LKSLSASFFANREPLVFLIKEAYFKGMNAIVQPSRLRLTFFMLILTWVYLQSQSFLGDLPIVVCGVRDVLQEISGAVNAYAWEHPSFARALLILYSGFGDLAVFSLFIFSVLKKSIRPILPLFIFVILRLVMQHLVVLPLPEGLIWYDPGISSLFSNYLVYNDFYFSAYVGINVLATLYRRELHLPWLNWVGYLVIVFQIFAALVLRAHYTTDIYTSVMTAILAFLIAKKLSLEIDRCFAHLPSYRWNLIALSVAFALLYSGMQYFIGMQPVPTCALTDVLHRVVEPINTYLWTHLWAADTMMILMNALLDILTVFVFIKVLWKKDIRPFFMLMSFFVCRQILQALIQLPIPEHLIWYDPGVPTLLQTYSVSSDFYFSGHTGSSLIAALELAYFRKRWLTIFGFSCFLFEASAVIVGYCHYTMDVYSAIITVLCLVGFTFKYAPRLNRLLAFSSRV
jgi:hypothetical protein